MECIPYSAEHCSRWNETLRKSRFRSLLLERGYMDYHSDRFEDVSLLFVDHKGRTEGVLASSLRRDTNTVVSHGGLTYGGLIPSIHATYTEVDQMLTLAADYYKRYLGVNTWVYKFVPQPYWTLPAEEILYWLKQRGAQLSSRGLSSALPLEKWADEDAIATLPTFSLMRARKVHAACEHGLRTEVVTPPDVLPEFWKILTDNLMFRHRVHPVHSLEEMTLLMKTFPERIRLATAWDDDKLVAGSLIYCSSPTLAHAQYIAANEAGRACGALDHIFAHVLHQSAREGFRWFDYGISTLHDGSGFNAGLLSQKEGFGARGMCYDIYTLKL